MMARTFSVSEVATLIRTSPPSVRRHAERFSEFLSEGAFPGHNVDKVFTEHDVRVLAYVAQRRSKSKRIPFDDIHAQLETLKPDKLPTLPEIEALSKVDGMPESTVTKQPPSEPAAVVAAASLDVIARNLNTLTDMVERSSNVDDIRAQLEALTARLEAVERQLAAMPTNIVGWGRRKE